jgi:hypothetical protein
MSIWDNISKGSEKLITDTTKTAPTATSNHVWCTAFIEGSDKCKCPKHAVKDIKEIKQDETTK